MSNCISNFYSCPKMKPVRYSSKSFPVLNILIRIRLPIGIWSQKICFLMRTKTLDSLILVWLTLWGTACRLRLLVDRPIMLRLKSSVVWAMEEQKWTYGAVGSSFMQWSAAACPSMMTRCLSSSARSRSADTSSLLTCRSQSKI